MTGIFPQITIDESSVGPRPVLDISRNEVGMVAHTNFGVKNKPVLTASLAEWKEKFGSVYETGLDGLISAIGFYLQNPTGALWTVPVTPTSVAGVKAKASFGVSTSTNTLDVEALSPGTEYNAVTVQLAAGTVSGTFKAIVTHVTTGRSETWDNLDIRTSTDNTAAAGGPNEPGKGSEWVKFVKIANNATNPSVIATTNLGATTAYGAGVAGTNGTPVAADYVGAQGTPNTGLYAFDPVPTVAFLFGAQQTSSTFTSGLQTYVAGRTVEDGEVRGIATHADNTAPGSASKGSLDSARLSMWFGFWKSTGMPVALQNSYLAPDGHLAGLMSRLQPWESTTNKQLLGLVEPRYPVTATQAKVLNQTNQINVVRSIRNRGIRAWGDNTLSSDSAWVQWNIRGEYDRIEQLAYDVMGNYVGQQNTDGLRQNVADSLDLMLAEEVDNAAIVAYRPTQCDTTNNTPSNIAAGKLTATMRVQFAYSAEIVTVAIDRVLDASA